MGRDEVADRATQPGVAAGLGVEVRGRSFLFRRRLLLLGDELVQVGSGLLEGQPPLLELSTIFLLLDQLRLREPLLEDFHELLVSRQFEDLVGDVVPAFEGLHVVKHTLTFIWIVFVIVFDVLESLLGVFDHLHSAVVENFVGGPIQVERAASLARQLAAGQLRFVVCAGENRDVLRVRFNELLTLQLPHWAALGLAEGDLFAV